MKLVSCFAELETVVPSEKNDCHSILADFRDDQISVLSIQKEKEILFKPLDSVF